MTQSSLSRFVDLKAYPLGQSQSAAYRVLAETCRKDLQEFGASVLPGFISESGLAALVREATALAPEAYHSKLVGNAYLADLDPSLPSDHPRNLTEETALAVVAYDQIPQESGLRALYDAKEFFDFVADVAGRGPIFPYECPFGAINISVMKDGDYLRWHFDQSDFVVSIPLQDPTEGGEFEFVRRIRRPYEENYDQVKALLQGDSRGVEILRFAPGSLVLFEGRNTIHRVATIRGENMRLGALFGFADRPGVTSSEYLRRIRYGRIK